MNTTRISIFASAESQTRFIRRKQKVLVTLYNHAVHSFLTLMQARVDVLRNSKHYHPHPKCLTILDRGITLRWPPLGHRISYPATYRRRTGSGPRTARGAPPTTQMGVASNGEENWGSLETKGTPPDLSSLSGKTPLTPLSTVTCRRTLPPPLLPVRIPWCFPIPRHCT